MKRNCLLIVVLGLALLSANIGWPPEAPAAAATPAPQANSPQNVPDAASVQYSAQISPFSPGAPYRIGPGDILNISVWKDEALTQQLPVLPDGTINFPLVGQLAVSGKTVDEFKQQLEKKIARYVPDPVLSVSITQVNSMMIYVVGRVNAPGRFILNTHVNALQALAMAGGPNPFAKRNRIKIFREENDKTLIFDFPYDDVSKGEGLAYNILLKRGDVMVVP